MGKKREPTFDMTWQEFYIQLLGTEDLDPVYVMLDGALWDGMDLDLVKRFLLAYWVYYNCAVAAYVAESPNFYHAMWQASIGSPRGFERRFMWGQQCKDTLMGLQEFGSPEDVVDHMTDHEDFHNAAKAIKSHRGFGPWMAWKIADMAERVLYIPVDFSTANLYMYKDPVAGAAVILYKDRHHDITDREVNDVVGDINDEFENCLAPPGYDRPVNVQEAETLLCKYKAHCYGAYPMNNDTIHLYKAFQEFRTDLGDHLVQFIPRLEEVREHAS